MRTGLFGLLILWVACVYAEGGKEYPDGHGGMVYLPLGDMSFADVAVSYTAGKKSPKGVHAQPDQAIGVPDYKTPSEPGFTALGCDGSMVLQFSDNVLIDVEGSDLFIFEVGPAVEPTLLAISQDGESWIDVGKIGGARTDIDIAPYVEEGDSFYFVRLTNASRSCSGKTPGADIDAVAAVGAGIRLSLNSSVLFDFGQAALKEVAHKDLVHIAKQISAMSSVSQLIIEGHTDNVGQPDNNLALSEARAKSVHDVLVPMLGLKDVDIAIKGRGEGMPIESNMTEEGRAKNRRVDIVVMP